MGPHAGRKVLTTCVARCKRFEAWEEDDYGTDQLGRIGAQWLRGSNWSGARCVMELRCAGPSQRVKQKEDK